VYINTVTKEVQDESLKPLQDHQMQSQYCTENYNKQVDGFDGACRCSAARKIADVQQ
jgi:hypothetical protein